MLFYERVMDGEGLRLIGTLMGPSPFSQAPCVGG